MIKNFFKVALRNLARNKAYSIINILGLTIGVIGCLVIFLISRYELSYDNFHQDKDRIYRLVSKIQLPNGDADLVPMIPDAAPPTIRNEFTGIESVAAFHTINLSTTIENGEAVKKFDRPKYRRDVTEAMLAEPQYFEVFKYEWLAGTPSTLSEPYRVVLSESKAHKYFGLLTLDEIPGKEVIYNDSLRFVVSGIVKDYPVNSDLRFKEFLSYSTIRQKVFGYEVDLNNWMNWNGNSQAFVKLEKGVSPEKIKPQLEEIVKKNVKFELGEKATFDLQPFSDVHFNTKYSDIYLTKAHLPTLYGLMGIAAFILLIAAVNFINLSTAQSLRRSKEIGVRKVLGSSRGKLVFQFLSETFVLTLIAMIIALILVPLILKLFSTYIPSGVTFNLLAPSTLLFLLVVCIITTLLAGFYPAKIVSAYLPVLSLKGKTTTHTSQKNYLRKGLIVFQFSISLVFIVCTLVVGRQINYALSMDMGFNKDAIITVTPEWKNGGEKAKLFAQEIGALTSVQVASVDMGAPADVNHWGSVLKCKETGVLDLRAQMIGGDKNYLPLYNIKLLAGRNIQNSDTIKEFLINETCAKKLGFNKPADAIGKILSTGMNDTDFPKNCPVVGILSDFHTESLHEPIKPVFMIESKAFCRQISVKLNTKGKSTDAFKSAISGIEKKWKEIYPDEKFDFAFFDENVAKFYGKEQKTAGIMNLAMFLAIFISCMGLFGLAAFTAQQRTKEIGIRKVLGASVAGIISMLTKDFLKPIFLAFVIATPVAWYFMQKWLEDFAYRVPVSWWIFIVSGGAAILVALFTVGIQTIRAAIANPVKSLRTE